MTLISAQASLEELSAEAKKTQSKMENAWICLQNPLKLSDIASLILKVSGNPLIAQSGIPSHQTEEIEVLRRTLEDLSNVTFLLRDLGLDCVLESRNCGRLEDKFASIDGKRPEEDKTSSRIQYLRPKTLHRTFLLL